MYMQTVNRTDTERAWLAVTNHTGHTLTTHWPVYKYNTAKNAASVGTNEGGLIADCIGAGTDPGGAIGLAFEDIADGNETGLVQVYGYHESVLVAKLDTDTTVRPGSRLVGYASVNTAAAAGKSGLTSVGVVGNYNRISNGIVEALDTIGLAHHNATQGAAASYADHVFIRGL